ncbi:nucleotidyltransferase family protein [Roseobacter weihaiensis]|uniref:nucleotidyltransferase family protein n=1 Tax=Roseobacter weihaiensis TaxID=2763262 RepID=UPI001D09BED5|nr:nucleotidyltransferase family protein [Roseobacter sp. H9]
MKQTDLSRLPIILLAAGQSSRMRGRDKLLEQIDGKPLLRDRAETARAATSGPVIVALPPAPHPRYATLEGCDVTPCPIPDAALGMSASLKGALAALPQDCPAVMVLLADLPELTAEDLRCVFAAMDQDRTAVIWRGTTQEGAPGHPIVFANPLFADLSRLSGDTGGQEVVRQHRDRTVPVPLPGRRARRDLDTPEDWAAWRATRQP